MSEEHKLIGTMCEETGVLGLVIDSMNTANFADGDLFVMADALGIAHDLTEHPNGIENIGTVFDEFQALGAIWFTRGQYADLTRDGVGSAHSPEHNIAGDVSRMARIAHMEGTHGRLYEEPPEDDTHEDYLLEIVKKAREDIPGELDEAFDEFDMEDYLQQALWGMRVGLAKQSEKYEGNGFAANNRFWNIHEALEGVFKSLEVEGQEFMLYIDADNQARAAEYYEEEEIFCDECGEETEEESNSTGYVRCLECKLKEEISNLDREEVIERLESEFCIACYDEESTDLLRECLVEAIGTEEAA